MPTFTLKNLAERTIAIDLVIHGRGVRLRGKGELAEMTGIGEVLKIHIPDSAGDFDIILSQDRFKGPIVEDKESGCDFRISLQASDLVKMP
jgi:hypothetical protein